MLQKITGTDIHCAVENEAPQIEISAMYLIREIQRLQESEQMYREESDRQRRTIRRLEEKLQQRNAEIKVLRGK